MSVRAFKPLRDRTQEIWSPDDQQSFGFLAKLFNEHSIGVNLACGQPLCPARAITVVSDPAKTLLRCGCTDRVIAQQGPRHGH